MSTSPSDPRPVDPSDPQAVDTSDRRAVEVPQEKAPEAPGAAEVSQPAGRARPPLPIVGAVALLLLLAGLTEPGNAPSASAAVTPEAVLPVETVPEATADAVDEIEPVDSVRRRRCGNDLLAQDESPAPRRRRCGWSQDP